MVRAGRAVVHWQHNATAADLGHQQELHGGTRKNVCSGQRGQVCAGCDVAITPGAPAGDALVPH